MEGRGRFPAHWGDPPRYGTKDFRLLPGGYGRGSSTLASWIRKKMDKEEYYARRPLKGRGGDSAYWANLIPTYSGRKY